MMSPIGKAVMLTIFVAILLAVYAGILSPLTNSSSSPPGALSGTEYAIVRTVLQYVPAIVAIGLMVIIWKGALKSD